MQGAIIGGIIGGIAVFILIVAGVFFYIKRKRESLALVKPYQSTPAIVIKPLETDMNLIPRSRNVNQLPNYESNQMLTTMTIPDAQV